MNRVSRRRLLRGVGLASLGVVATTRGSRTTMAVSEWDDTSLTYDSSDGTIPSFELNESDIQFQFSWSNFPSDGATVDVNLQARLPNREDSAGSYATVFSGSLTASEESGSTELSGGNIYDSTAFPVSIVNNTPIELTHFTVPSDQESETTRIDFKLEFSYSGETVARTSSCDLTVNETTDIPTIGENQWYADEGSGGTLQDALGSVTATINGATWETESGPVGGNYLYYDGSAYTQTESSIDAAQDTFTVFGWVRPHDYTNFGNVFCGSAPVGTTGDPGWFLFTNGTEGNIGAVAGEGSFANDTPFVNVGEWGFLAAVFDGGGARLLTFDNTQELADVSGGGADRNRNPRTGDPLEFGRNGNGEHHLNGDIGFWGFSSSKLSKTEITDVWEATKR